MKTQNTYYVGDSDLLEFASTHGIGDSESLLIQVFTAKNDIDFIGRLLELLVSNFPSASLIGATTDGEINNGNISTGKTVVSFTTFESTGLETYIAETSEDYYLAGKDLATAIIKEDTKVVIAFIDSSTGNGDNFLKGIESVNSDVIVAGGLAATDGTSTQSYIFTKSGICKNGVVAIALSSQLLNVFTDYSFNWLPIGKTLHVTNAKDNRVYTIDDRTAVETYDYYLGKNISSQLPRIGIEFPLIIQRDGLNIARATIAKEDDGSLVFAGNVQKGDKVKFGYGDSDIILGETQKHLDRFVGKPIESIFIYSCMARRRFMPSAIESETKAYGQLASTSGFFTHGEFFSQKGSKELLNQSMTVLAMSESEQPNDKKVVFESELTSSYTIKALSHLVSVTTRELEGAVEELRALSNTDYLSGLYNRRYFDDSSKNIFYLSARSKRQLSLIMLDIDEFKNINDTYGHSMGDKVIVKLAKLMQALLRKSDLIYRYGGEEFVILLPDTDATNAQIIAESIRKIAQNEHIKTVSGQNVGFTISLGVSEVNFKTDDNIECALLRADDALYAAKNAGRNQTAVLLA